MTLAPPQSYISEINENDGYILNVKLTVDELEQMRSFIHQHAVELVSRYYPEHKSHFAKTPMDEFHLLSDLIDHKKVWTKKNRIFPVEIIQEIKKMPFYKTLDTMFGGIRVANEEELYNEEIYWRFVRPNKKDIGPLHADKWFWDLGHGKMPKSYFRLKIWMPIWCETSGNGLRVVPGSHKEQYTCGQEERDGFLKPLFDETKYDLDVLPLPNKPGETVIFHDELLHGGCFNTMDKSRVSVEFTMLIKEEYAQ